jgi:asparagine synthase (glutamine-hydrolysing)
MVNDLRGMFAFGLWDAAKRALLLARDPYGIKPLYYVDDGWTLRFASQVKALLAGGKVSRSREPAGLVGFCLFGSVPEPFTTYQQIRSLPAGSTLWVDRVGARDTTQYCAIADVYCNAETWSSSTSGEDLQHFVRDELVDSVRHHLVSDVPVGAFLSSRVDSGALVGLMRDVGQQDIQTVTLAFDDKFRGTGKDEASLAEGIATQYKTRHTTRVVTEQEFSDDLPKILDAMDQPTISGFNTWFVSKAARELGLKVAISGLGGNELFGGTASFRELPRCVHAMTVLGRIPFLGDFARQLLSGLDHFLHVLDPKTGGHIKVGHIKYAGNYSGAYLLRRALFMPWELEAVVGAETAAVGLRRLNPVACIDAALKPEPRSVFGKVAVLESSLYMRNQLLRDTDWASMAHSLEVRVPLIDFQLLSRLASVTTKHALQSKRLLANSPRVPLPPKVVERVKTGFETPIQEWLQRDKRIQRWRQLPSLAVDTCPWGRRWAFQVVTA